MDPIAILITVIVGAGGVFDSFFYEKEVFIHGSD